MSTDRLAMMFSTVTPFCALVTALPCYGALEIVVFD